HVAHLRAHMKDGGVISLAVNVAARPAQQAFLEAEFALLQYLHERFGLNFLPHPFVTGETAYMAEDGSQFPLRLFIAEWFEDYHEFHISLRDGEPAIKVWDLDRGEYYLSPPQTRSLYRKMAAAMTGYLDPATFSRIYPWHHAAGDFILRRDGDEIDVRLVTARGYEPLFPLGDDPDERWLALLHFFFNLTIRMRLDRLDGTGELAWAAPSSLEGVIAGFLEAWQWKVEAESAPLPSSEEILDLLRHLGAEEWLSMAEPILEIGAVEADEPDFLRPRLRDHAEELADALREYGEA
ncbi:MAG: hypothetical protein ACLGPL_04570, partial [Acidobacteriota bacterium]